MKKIMFLVCVLVASLTLKAQDMKFNLGVGGVLGSLVIQVVVIAKSDLVQKYKVLLVSLNLLKDLHKQGIVLIPLTVFHVVIFHF